MATTYQTPPIIGVTAPDEDMDLLSDNGKMEQDQDQDLIDIDAPNTHNADEDFDFTIDDVASDRGAMPALEDDEMLDEYDEGDTFTHEETMQDDPQPDDELLDDASEHDEDTYVEDSAYDLTAHGQQHDDTFVTAIEDQTNHESFTENHQTTDAQLQTAPEYVTDKIDYVEEEEITVAEPGSTNDIVQPPVDEAESLQTMPVNVTETEHIGEEHSEPIAADLVSSSNEQNSAVAGHQNDNTPEISKVQNLDAVKQEDQLIEEETVRFAPAEPIKPLSTEIQTAAQTQAVNDAADEQADDPTTIAPATEIPTVLVDYYGDEYSLFPPAQSLPGLSEFADYSYLLEDVACFHKSIHDLLEECKHMLSTDIDEDQELDLEVPALGLMLAQSSQDSMAYTMEQIATVFHTLNANDELQDMQPLWVILKSKTRFASRLAALQQAVNEQKGMSEVSHLLGLEEMDGAGQLDALGIQHVIEQADYESSEDAENENAKADEHVEGVELEAVEGSVPTATVNEHQREDDYQEEPAQNEATIIEGQADEAALIEEQPEDVHSSATSITLKEGESDPSELDELKEELQTVVQEVVSEENEHRTGYGLDEDFDEDEQDNHYAAAAVPVDESVERDETAEGDGLTHQDHVTDAATSEVQTGTEGWELDNLDDVPQANEAELQNNDQNVVENTDEKADENDEDLLTFEEEDKIEFENGSGPAPVNETHATLTEATLTDDNIVDFTEEAETSQTGTKRTWEQHLDDDLLVDDGLESPKRARHSDVA